MSDRTFSMQSEPGDPLKSHNIKAWQEDIKKLFALMGLNCPIDADGIYGPLTRSYTADLVRASGMLVEMKMKHGEVTPELRHHLRTGLFTEAEIRRQSSPEVVAYRDKLKHRWTHKENRVHTPTTIIITDAWGWHPGVHDGVDVVTPKDALCFAMVKCKILDVRSQGWWNLGAPNDPNLKAQGDGIVQMEVLEQVGPFQKGMHIGYGHQEKAVVTVGQVVEAGHVIGHAGFANAWHIHLMVNTNHDLRGIGTKDPRPFIEYAVKNG